MPETDEPLDDAEEFPPKPWDPDQMLTTNEVADLCRVTRPTVNLWIRNHQLPAIRLGGSGRYRVRRGDLREFVTALYDTDHETTGDIRPVKAAPPSVDKP